MCKHNLVWVLKKALLSGFSTTLNHSRYYCSSYDVEFNFSLSFTFPHLVFVTALASVKAIKVGGLIYLSKLN